MAESPDSSSWNVAVTLPSSNSVASMVRARACDSEDAAGSRTRRPRSATTGSPRLSCSVRGSVPTGVEYARGAYYLPTVLDGLPYTAVSCQEEAFGPVLVALPFKDEADLIRQANGTVFGLACGIWTESFKKAWRIARALEVGSVWINTWRGYKGF